jgi:hypothetical protein
VIGAAVDCPSWKTSIGIAATLSLESGVNTVGSFGFFEGDFLGVSLVVALGVVGSGVGSTFAFCTAVNLAQFTQLEKGVPCWLWEACRWTTCDLSSVTGKSCKFKPQSVTAMQSMEYVIPESRTWLLEWTERAQWHGQSEIEVEHSKLGIREGDKVRIDSRESSRSHCSTVTSALKSKNLAQLMK